MKMNYVRIILIGRFDKTLCNICRNQSMQIEKTCCNAMKFHVKIISYTQ